MQRQKRVIIWTVGMIVTAMFVFLIACFLYMNILFPSPNVYTYIKDEKVKLGNYQIMLTGWQWHDGDIIHDLYPGYKLIEMDGEEYPTSKERIGLAEISVTKVEDDNTCIDLSEITFESGAWGNQFDLDLFMKINPDLNSLTLHLKGGETQRILFPITMLDIQFTESDWKQIDDREFFVVLQYYPNKHRLLCE